MNRYAFAIFLMAFFSGAGSASASPCIGTDLSFEFGGHRWGFWTLIDTPSHDYMSQAFRKTNWMNNGSDGAATQRFHSYWIIGFGPFAAVYVCRGFALFLIALIAVFVAIWLRRKRWGEPQR